MLAGCSQSGGDEVREAAAPVAAPVEPTAPSAASPGPQTVPPASALRVAIEPPEIDFGEVGPNVDLPGSFKIYNRGTAPLTVARSQTSCKCTAADDLTGQVIPAGAFTPLNATLTTSATPGPKDAKVFLQFQGYEGMVQAKLAATVVLPIESEPPYVDALKGVSSGVLQVRARDGQPFRIISSNGEPPDYVDFDPAADALRSEYQVRWSVAGMPCQGMRLWWILETDRSDCPILPARIRHECTGSRADPNRFQRQWTFKEYLVNAGRVSAGQPVELEIDIDNRGGAQIESVQSLTPGSRARLLDASDLGDRETRCRVEFTPDAGMQGLLYARLRVMSTTGDGEIAIVAQVAPPGAG